MPIKTQIKKGAYFDSVSLMQISRKLNSIKGVADSAVIMATRENKNIIKASGLLTAEIEKAGDNDLAIAVKAKNDALCGEALKEAESLLTRKEAPSSETRAKADSVDSAVKNFPGLNMALISVNGRYAGKLAFDCLEKGMNVMVFSDNVPLETELELKKLAVKKGLLLMGPDCGTAVINGAPLGFANAVNRGRIGVVGPSGTGMQEVTSVISNAGAGISQAIGTGARDVKKDVGGLTTIAALKMLAEDPGTDVIVIVSKPPHEEVLKKILGEVKKIKKPVVSVFIGAEFKSEIKNLHTAGSLYAAGLKAVSLSKGENIHRVKEEIYNEKLKMTVPVKRERAGKEKRQRYIRGLFSGGTFAAEAQFVLKEIIGAVNSNIPFDKKYKLKNSMELKENSVIDLGEDEFTFGRPHPMIDFSLRNKMIAAQSKDREVSVILLDLVLGYGSTENPLEDIGPHLKAAFRNNPRLTVVTSITGTDADPQNKRKVAEGLKALGVHVFPSNYLAALMAGEIVRAK